MKCYFLFLLTFRKDDEFFMSRQSYCYGAYVASHSCAFFCYSAKAYCHFFFNLPSFAIKLESFIISVFISLKKNSIKKATVKTVALNKFSIRLNQSSQPAYSSIQQELIVQIFLPLLLISSFRHLPLRLPR